jgi:hypothetical protein
MSRRSTAMFVMFIYNVTVNVTEAIHERWLAWMRSTHIPDVLKTGCFTSSRLLKVLYVNDEGHTYSVQYLFNDMADIERYQKQFAQALQAEHKQKFNDEATAFRTLLEIIE